MRARHAFCRPCQIKFKTEKLQFSKLYCTQNKHILKIMKKVFVHSIYSSKYMALGFENHLYKHYGRHFPRPVLQIYTLLLQNKIVNLDIIFNYDHATYKL